MYGFPEEVCSSLYECSGVLKFGGLESMIVIPSDEVVM